MKEEMAGLKETIQSLRGREESFGASNSTPTYASSMLTFIRQQHCRSRNVRPATL